MYTSTVDCDPEYVTSSSMVTSSEVEFRDMDISMLKSEESLLMQPPLEKSAS